MKTLFNTIFSTPTRPGDFKQSKDMWDDIIERTSNDNQAVRYKKHEHSLVMAEHNNPVSITAAEFAYIRGFIAKHRLRNGYEVATAFGISALAAALGMKGHGGRLVTMDAYIEEKYNDCFAYSGRTEVHKESHGLRSVKKLRDVYGLEKILFPTTGWSPNDTAACLSTVFSANDKLDYAFIDGLHEPEQIRKDFDVIVPFINRRRFAIFFHDSHVLLADNALVEHIESTLGCLLRLVAETSGDIGFNLSVLTNIRIKDDPETLTHALKRTIKCDYLASCAARGRISEQDALIRQEQDLIRREQELIVRQDNRIRELDARIRDQDARISQLDKEIARLNSNLAKPR